MAVVGAGINTGHAVIAPRADGNVPHVLPGHARPAHVLPGPGYAVPSEFIKPAIVVSAIDGILRPTQAAARAHGHGIELVIGRAYVRARPDRTAIGVFVDMIVEIGAVNAHHAVVLSGAQRHMRGGRTAGIAQVRGRIGAPVPGIFIDESVLSGNIIVIDAGIAPGSQVAVEVKGRAGRSGGLLPGRSVVEIFVKRIAVRADIHPHAPVIAAITGRDAVEVTALVAPDGPADPSRTGPPVLV